MTAPVTPEMIAEARTIVEKWRTLAMASHEAKAALLNKANLTCLEHFIALALSARAAPGPSDERPVAWRVKYSAEEYQVYDDERDAQRTAGRIEGGIVEPLYSQSIPAPHAQLSDTEIEAAWTAFVVLRENATIEMRERFGQALRSLRPAAPVGKWSEDAELVESMTPLIGGGSTFDQDDRAEIIRAILDALQQRLGHSGERGK